MVERALIWQVMLYFFFPLWLAAGLADYLCHRKTHIEHTSGTKEALLHLLQLGQVGLPLLAGLLFEINALLLLLMIACVAVHTLTSIWDIAYTTRRRHITPFEQHVHAYLIMIPITAVAFMVILYGGQFVALFGLGTDVADFQLRWKYPPLPVGLMLAIIAAGVVCELLPLSEELWRTLRARKQAGSVVVRT